jgi:hypothetical protein
VALAPADCPTQLPTQYRWRWGVSRPCSGRERVGPPRLGHQGHRLTRKGQALQPRASNSREIQLRADEHARAQTLTSLRMVRR